MNRNQFDNTTPFGVDYSSPTRVIERRSAPLKFDDKVLPMFEVRDFDVNQYCQQQQGRQAQQQRRQRQQPQQSFNTSYLSLSFFNDDGEEEFKQPLDKVALRAVHDARGLLDSFRKSTAGARNHTTTNKYPNIPENSMQMYNDSMASLSIEDL